MKKTILRTAMTLSIAATLWFVAPVQAADKYTIVRAFNSSTGGSIPYGGLLMDQAGNLYGADSQGGTSNWGTIFELSPNGQGGYQYTMLHDCGITQDCSVPMGSMVMDRVGNLYGVTIFGGVFELSPQSSGVWVGSVIHNFNGGVDGSSPSPLVVDAAGNLYGTNASGGNSNLGYVFELSPSASGWTLTHLHDFSGSDGAGTTSSAAGLIPSVVLDSAGNLYGTTGAGGSLKCSGGCGVVFELKNQSGVWTETVVHSFKGADGSMPIAPLLVDASGNIYGTASGGGKNGDGVVFKSSLVSGSWRTQILHNFTGVHLDGAYPNSGLIMDGSGNLFGTTLAGGADLQSCQVMSDTGCGTAFELSPSGTSWKMSILHAFTGRKDGGFPGGVVKDASGNLYGAAQAGGSLFDGVIFKITP